MLESMKALSNGKEVPQAKSFLFVFPDPWNQGNKRPPVAGGVLSSTHVRWTSLARRQPERPERRTLAVPKVIGFTLYLVGCCHWDDGEGDGMMGGEGFIHGSEGEGLWMMG